MKKLLFTLATLLAGFAANAGNVELAMTGANEYTLGAGETQAVTVKATALDGTVRGFQFQYVIRDANGEAIPNDVAPVVFKASASGYFTPLGMSKLMGNAMGSSIPEDAVGAYRGLLANPSKNIVWTTDYTDVFTDDDIADLEDQGENWQQWFNLGNVWRYTIQVNSGWTGEYVTVDFDDDFAKFVFVEGTPLTGKDFSALDIKVINKDYVAEDKDLTGEIIFGELDPETGKVPVSYNGPEEVTLTVTVDGNQVEIVDGMFALPEYGTYEVYVYANAEGYKEESRMKIFTWEAPVVEQTAAPEVNFEMRGDALWCVITGEGDIYVDNTNYGPAPVEFVVTTQTAEVQEGSYTVYAIADGKTQSETVIAAWTCEAKVVEYAEKPVITYDEETFTVTATSADEVHLFINGVEVEGNTYTFEQTAEDVTYQVSAYASANGKENSEYASMECFVPAKAVEYTAVPVVTVEITDDAYIFTATGDGEVVLYVDGVEVENPYTVVRPETAPEEPYAVYVYATAQEAGKEMSSSDVQRVVIEPKVAPQPVEPEADVTVDVNDDAVVINVDGEGEYEYILYVNGEAVEYPCTFTRGDQDQEISIVVVAIVDGQEVEVYSDTYTVPAKEVKPEPTQGFWLVLIDQFGVEHEPILLNEGVDGDYTTTYTFEYYPWGEFTWNPNLTDEQNEANRPNVPFYFIINGVRYGADTDLRATFLGNAMENPLGTEDNDWNGCYTVPVGFSYTLGVAKDNEGNYYVYAAVAKKVDVEEINATKAVAGVRYFNMAGQEMQEANGMTIVVTTYTDGTTSTAKIMK